MSDGSRGARLLAVELEPENALTRFSLGLVLKDHGRDEESAELQRTLIAELPPGVDPQLVARLRQSLQRYQQSAGD